MRKKSFLATESSLELCPILCATPRPNVHLVHTEQNNTFGEKRREQNVLFCLTHVASDSVFTSVNLGLDVGFSALSL